MAKLTIKANCGCQFNQSLEAEFAPENEGEVLRRTALFLRQLRTHATTENHTLEFHGEIREPPR